MFNVIVSVPDEWTDYKKLQDKCDYYLSKKIKEGEKINILITKPGSLSERYAMERGFGILCVPIDWRLGKKAFLVRDNRLVELSNACIAFFSSYGSNIAQQNIVDLSIKSKVVTRKVMEDEGD